MLKKYGITYLAIRNDNSKKKMKDRKYHTVGTVPNPIEKS
jgi:hypothetical protein